MKDDDTPAQEQAALQETTHSPIEWGAECPAAPDRGPHECAGNCRIAGDVANGQYAPLRGESTNSRPWCAQYDRAVPSSVSMAWVHPSTSVGRVICTADITCHFCDNRADERIGELNVCPNHYDDANDTLQPSIFGAQGSSAIFTVGGK